MKNSNIEWTDKTWNPTTGCTICSKECTNCYALNFTNQFQFTNPKYNKGFNVFVEHHYELNKPFTWKKPSIVFVNSMSDLFHEQCSVDFIKKVFKVMNSTPQHTYQILTKRHHRLVELSSQLHWTDNIWMGVSVGNVAGVRRIQALKKTQAKNKFLSVEPLIEELPNLNLEGIDWVIVGGESGSNAREIKKDWVLKVQQDCKLFSVSFFFKQWGDSKFNPDPIDPTRIKGNPLYSKGGCQIDGKIYRENPCLKIQAFGQLTFEY